MPPRPDPAGHGPDPRDAAYAWARFRRIMRWMNAVAVVAGVAAVAGLLARAGTLPWIFAGLVFVAVYATILLAAALMSLMFMSNGTGHDEQVVDFTQGAHPIDD